jgi:hypothetical protein
MKFHLITINKQTQLQTIDTTSHLRSNLQCLGARAKPNPGAAKEATGPRHPVRDQWLFQGQMDVGQNGRPLMGPQM